MNTTIKCILLDDELPGLTYLKMLCEQIPGLEVIKAFNSPDAFLKELPCLDFDLCILDINMPGMNGLQIANLLNGKHIIFTTAYKEYAAETYDLDAVDYVVKPIKKERLQQAIVKVQNRNQQNSRKFFQFNTNKGKSLIFFDQLFYIKTSDVDARDKIAMFYDGTAIILKNISFDKLQQILPVNSFVRINKKEFIAIKAIQLFSFDEVTLNVSAENGKAMTLNLGEVYREAFLQKVKS